MYTVTVLCAPSELVIQNEAQPLRAEKLNPTQVWEDTEAWDDVNIWAE